MKWRFCSSCQKLLFLIFFYLHFSGAILLFVLSGTDAGDVIIPFRKRRKFKFMFKFKFIYSHLFNYNTTIRKKKEEVKNRANYTLN